MNFLGVHVRRIDLLFCLLLLVLAVILQQGRLGSSIQGLDLTTDPANYACMAAAEAHPEAFAKDAAFADPAKYGVHATLLVPLLQYLADDGNFGTAYLKLSGAHFFLHWLAFYLLGVVLLKKRWQALIFALLMGQVYWMLWGTYWGAGLRDFTPRSTFTALYPFYIMAALAILHRPRWWPPFMAATGLLVYVHSISTLPVAFGFWLGFLLHRPEGWTRQKHWAWLVFSGCCFVLVMSPFALKFLRPGVSLNTEDIELLRQVLLSRYDPEFTRYWQGLWQFALHHIKLPLLPLALAGAYVLHRYGNTWEKEVLGQFAMWAAGVLVMVALFLLDHETGRIFNRHPYQFDLIRVLRFLVFFTMCIPLMACNVLLRHFSTTSLRWWRVVAFCQFGIFVGLFFGGQNDMGRTSLAWYWNSLSESRYQEAYDGLLQRDELIKAVQKHTEPGSSIFFEHEDQALRYRALRSLAYSWKDASIFYYAKDTQGLRRWEETRAALAASPTAYLQVGARSGADYLLSDRPEDKPALEKLGRIVWENEHYVLVRLPSPSGRKTSP